MLQITPTLTVPMEEFSFTFARSGGPGGQNVNKVSSKVVLRWTPARSPGLPADLLARLLAQQKNRLTKDGELLITSQKTRDQGRNLDDCLEKLRALVLAALHVPKARKATRPSRGAKERRLSTKRIRGHRKEGRQRPSAEE